MRDGIKECKASESPCVGNDSNHGISGFQSRIEDDEVSALDTDMNEETSTLYIVSIISQDDGIYVREVCYLLHA